MQYILTDTKTATGYSLQTISGVKYRLFQFTRIPDIGVGDWMVDPTDPVGYKQIAYVGSAGTGYAHEYVSPASFPVDTIINFYRATPDVTAAANEQDVARRLDRLARFMGSRLDPSNGFPLSVPVFRKAVFRVFKQSDRLTIALEKLDEVLGLLKDDYDTRITSHEERLDDLEEDVETFMFPNNRTTTRTTFFDAPQLVYDPSPGTPIAPWHGIDLSPWIPARAKSIIGTVRTIECTDRDEVQVWVSPNNAGNVAGSVSNNPRAALIHSINVGASEGVPGGSSMFQTVVNGSVSGEPPVWSGNRKIYLKLLRVHPQSGGPGSEITVNRDFLKTDFRAIQIYVAGYHS